MTDNTTIKHKISHGFRSVAWSEHGGDALRNFIIVVVPSIFLFYRVGLDEAIFVGIGALFASLSDSPGNSRDKWSSALWCLPLFFLSAFVTAVFLEHPVLLIPWLGIGAFFLTAINIYGVRANFAGLMSIILMAFTIGLWPEEPLMYSFYIGTGAAYYYLIIIALSYVSPFRSMKFAVADILRSLSRLIDAKSDCYDINIPLYQAYTSIGGLHVKINDQQDHARRLLLRHRNILTGTKDTGKRYWFDQLIRIIDLYEMLLSLDYDYEEIRDMLGSYKSLDEVRTLISSLGQEVNQISWDYLAFGTSDSAWETNFERQIESLRQHSHTLDEKARVILEATVLNIQAIAHRIAFIKRGMKKEEPIEERSKEIDYERFVTLQAKGVSPYFQQLKRSSASFRFSLRMGILFFIGGMIGLLLPDFKYTYWILLTIAIVAKPSYFNTNLRNIQRISGTLLGIAIGILLLYLVHSIQVLLCVAALSLFGFFLFNRVQYLVSVLMLTPGVIIALHLTEGDVFEIIGSRILFTLGGCALAVLGWYFIPIKQQKNLFSLAKSVVDKNRDYFEIIRRNINVRDASEVELRYARKEAHRYLASFSELIHQITHEPGKQQLNLEIILQFQALAYRLNSLLIGYSFAANSILDDDISSQSIARKAENFSSLFEQLEALQLQFRR